MRKEIIAALFLVGLSLVVAIHGQPDPDSKWEHIADKWEGKLEGRAVHVSPYELVRTMDDDYIELHLIDLRDESSWNRFRIRGSIRMSVDELREHKQRFDKLGGTGVVVLIDNDEELSTLAWKRLMTMGAPNAYILEGGINGWLNVFGAELLVEGEGAPIERLHASLGANHPVSRPVPNHEESEGARPVIKLRKKVTKSGGCG